MTSQVLTHEQIAVLRNFLSIIMGSADLIAIDERAHPILAAKARTISKTVEKIVELLEAAKVTA